MKNYDLIVIGSGSAMNLVDPMLQQNPEMKIAVIDKDEPGGICLTRGCIPSKILLYPAELVRIIEEAGDLGLEVRLKRADFPKIMARMRRLIDADIDSIRNGLSSSENIDYYHAPAEFVAPYTLMVSGETLTSTTIFLCTGSQPVIPPVKGLDSVGYITSDDAFRLKELPPTIAIVGGGYIAAEFGHFFSAMGAKVTVIGRNPQFLPEEEPEVSALTKSVLGKHMEIVVNCEVREAEKLPGGRKSLRSLNRESGEERVVEADEIMIAAGRGPTTGILHPEKAGIGTTREGWIEVNEYLETSQPGVWAFGDADGKFPFKHVANYESQVVYYNAVLKRRVKVDYHAVPSAVFTYPEVASVGMREREAISEFGEENILIGYQKYEDTAKGEAMNVKGYFVKAIVQRDSLRILGAHIVGPYASILIQEIINVMNTEGQDAHPLMNSMHIHPSITEVVDRAFSSLMEPHEYHHILEHVGFGHQAS
ncbi:MAG TPA: dihydrolipoyl dehydrogenase [Nitrososphaerales archaeon]|nr:dihydrolipoyl dehydrogenase [Nitrososphaerales archaeon]